MALVLHELKSGRTSLIIWSLSVAFLLAICVMIYPEMASEMSGISETFAEMGAFSEAFGMDKMNFGEFTGYFGVECGNVLGLGGALFAAICAITALAKEEHEHTAEFLLTCPIARSHIITAKLISVIIKIFIFNAVIAAFTAASIALVGESIEIGTIALLFLGYFLMQIEIAAICFGISAFLRRGGLGLGLGTAVGMYFLNIIANLTESAKFLKYITPFGYADSAGIISDGALNGPYLAVGAAIAVLGAATAYYRYTRKDIA